MLKLLANPWLMRVFGFGGLAVVIMLVGPLLAIGDYRPLESLAARWILILLLALVWLLRHVWRLSRATKAQSQMVDELVQEPASDSGAEASAEEVATIRERFEEALAVLKKTRGASGRLSLYDLPWYVIIGPPGSGKTTALASSGLRFPLGERFGPAAIRGVGGTRNCDWWFTDDAVLIDTAGRYTTQDSDAATDQAAWLGFLSLLKKYRRRRPINGIFVAISVADVLTQSEAERRAHALAVKQRVTELDRHFGIRFPVYVLFTKCDLVAGFAEFFEDLGRSEREQVWGFTLPLKADAGGEAGAALGVELDRLVRRLNERLLERMSREPDPARRALIHGFPKQVAGLKEHLARFLDEVFQSSRYETGPLLRGAYFTSGTQQGTPIDRLLGSLAGTFQIDARAMPATQGAGKSYFITNVLKKVAFAEAGIAGTNRRVEVQRARLQTAAYAGIGVAAAGAVALWGWSYTRNADYVERVAAGGEQVRMQLAELDHGDSDPSAVLAALDAARAIPGGYGDRIERGGRPAGFGLSQAGKLGDQAVAAYRRLLNELFLARLMLHLERQLQRGGSSPDYTYEALKAYLMLDSAEHYDADAIKAFVRTDWAVSRPRTLSGEQQVTFDGHLDALFEQRPMPLPLPLSDDVIAEARREVAAIPLEDRIYGRLTRTFQADIPGFSIRAAAGGPAADVVFVRRSGAALAEELPPLYTREAYRRTFIDRSRELTAELVGESWILGERESLAPLEEERVLARVRELYLAEFARHYEGLLNDVALASFATAEEGARIFNVLSRPQDSPLLLLLEAVDRQTSLERTDDGENGTAAAGGDRVTQLQQRLQQVLGTSGEAPRAEDELLARNLVQERFEPLNALVRGADGQPRPVDPLLGLLRELYEHLSVVASEAAGGAIAPPVQQGGQAVLQQVRMEASSQPELLVRGLLQAAASRTAALTTGGLRAYLNELWQAGPLAMCRQAIAGRYPVEPASTESVRLDDFAEFFGYGGAIDSFFNTHLRQYVDTTSSPWRTRATGNVPIQLSSEALAAFERADAIKRSFFRQGSMAPAVAFDLRPLEMDVSLARFLLDLEGEVITYEFGPRARSLLQWPGPNPGTEVRMEFRDREGATRMHRLQGPWAWFRLLDEAGLQPAGVPEQFELTFSHEGREVVYELTARSAFNPFSLPQLRQFRCPGNL